MPVQVPSGGGGNGSGQASEGSGSSSSGQTPRIGSDLKRWLLAGVGVTLPLFVLQRTNPEWQYPYVTLILLSLVIFYADDLTRFVREVQSL